LSSVFGFLHDGVGTSLLALRGTLPPENTKAHTLLNQLITDMRTVSHNLMPDELTTLGLAGALSETARRLQEASGIRFLFVSAGQVRSFSPTAELALYRAVLELMHNIVRHSEATEAVVQLVYHPDLLNITVEDNGRGFDAQKQPDSKGIGLKSVASRTEWLAAKLAVDSSAAGTTVRLDVPYV
jgi:signal transduction histidine kinase